MTIREFGDRDEFTGRAARLLADSIAGAIARHGSCAVVLAGGHTPRPVYAALGRMLLADDVDPAALFFILGDERHVPEDDAERNARMVRESLFAFFRPEPARLIFWDSPPLAPEECAARYEKKLADLFATRGRGPDLTVLGLGADGHTASLFPGAEVIGPDGDRRPLGPDEPARALAAWVPDKRTYRLSLSARFLRTSESVVFLVAGADKDEAVRKLLSGDRTIPASWVAHEGTRVLRLA